ncbi:MAG: phage holin family protein [bacterium]|nr:phage holin family protein [bacterium]
MKKLAAQFLGAIIGLWIAYNFVDGVNFTGAYIDLILIAVALALLNAFLRPVLNFFAFPLRILTLGLFSFIINMIIIWLIDYLFVQLAITGLFPLFAATIIISIFIGIFQRASKEKNE